MLFGVIGRIIRGQLLVSKVIIVIIDVTVEVGDAAVKTGRDIQIQTVISVMGCVLARDIDPIGCPPQTRGCALIPFQSGAVNTPLELLGSIVQLHERAVAEDGVPAAVVYPAVIVARLGRLIDGTCGGGDLLADGVFVVAAEVPVEGIDARAASHAEDDIGIDGMRIA